MEEEEDKISCKNFRGKYTEVFLISDLHAGPTLSLLGDKKITRLVSTTFFLQDPHPFNYKYRQNPSINNYQSKTTKQRIPFFSIKIHKSSQA
ncbi:hypothetical protein Patl1_06476 [Pistacia atlantica]|uniref:Uncharacterized protein n=1 Tax=Pistacia atlantica TaxID=434234 RepID=A0ACC1BNY8_9ROSI|nr:hypothetical protein Patl1_06476 [Pistacia atlantica]